MHRLLIFYRLRPSVSVSDYMKWSEAVDQPAVRSYSQCTDLRVSRVLEQAGTTIPVFDIVEEATVSDYGKWQELLSGSNHREIKIAFDSFVVEDSVLTVVSDVE